VLDLRSLRLAPGDQKRERVSVTARPFTLGGVVYQAAPIEADVAVTRLRNGLVFDLAFETTVHGPCHRCLEDATIRRRVKAQEYQADAPQPGLEDEETSEYVKDGILDTGLWASDALLLLMPHSVLCRRDCVGLCATCGHNLNEGPCDCPPPEPDARWAALKGLFPAEES